jgi:RNA polymerase sigma factor (sigma-70 family)
MVFRTFKGRRSHMHDPDADDVARAGQGDRRAAARLIGKHAPKLLTVARRMLGAQAEAEDAVQEVFLRLWTHAARWQPGKAKFETWLYRVMLNQCYDRLRRRPTAPLEAAEDMADDAALPDTGLDEGVLAREIARALDVLPERQKAAILLCHFRELGNIEAAEIMGISVEALESLLARGRRGLRSRLEHLKNFAGDGS